MTECSEKRIDLPQNVQATCWWLSINLALFHKERDDLRNSLRGSSADSADSADTTLVKMEYTKIYNYYLGKTENVMTKEAIEIFRKSEQIKKLFPIKQDDKFKFEIAGNTFQDAHEYLSNLKNKNLLDNIFISPPIEKENHFWKIYDVLLNTRIINKEGQTINSTIILYFPRMEYKAAVGGVEQIVPNKTPIELIKTINNNNTIFSLDAIVAVTTGHYFAYVNCTGTEEWLRYGATFGGKMEKTYTTFENMLETETQLPEQATLLFYSRVSSSRGEKQ